MHHTTPHHTTLRLITPHHTTGTDKKTSVLDYVIKSLYDHNEESVLSLLEDLSLVEETARLSGECI